MTHRHGLMECILPPHIVEKVVENGTPEQQEWARKTLIESGKLRGERQVARDLVMRGQALDTPARDCTVYDAERITNLPGRRVRGESDSPFDDLVLPDVNEAFNGATATFDLYKDIYGRNSIDGRGLPLISTVNYDINYENAFWNGTQMVYGRGHEGLPESQRLFNRFTIDISVIGHELTHGVVQYEAGLVYFQQAGALNESWADVFGSLVRQRFLNQTADEADWIIGKGLFTANVRGVGIRSMKEPGKAYDDPLIGVDPQPGHMDNYVYTSQDNGGVHINSGIPNHAFYVTAKEMGGYAWEKAGKIWYVTLRDKLRSMSEFNDAASLTYQVAGQLYGSGSLEQQAVRTGWKEVGLDVDSLGVGDGGQIPEELPGCWQVALMILMLLANSTTKLMRRIGS